ncbi:lipopolysaccharide biosynthesis protein [Sphingobacterium chungjuense]|uniref:lipopolysaccharide biosynthesis protein n=1 Tax=Sphingobacterium chungjuense TaxID=2675553 RepID=UPI001409AD56|nr:oligosaccharide flippase family protein [Sphingobacterium chungjuense]
MASNNSRIAKNTLFLYVRMFLNMGLSLYTSRIVLGALGIENFGIYSVVGGVITLFSFFNSAMSSATQRFLAITIGEKDSAKLHKVFNVSLLVHIGIAAIVLLFAETLGLWFVNEKLNLPSDRMGVINIVYQLSVLASIIGIIQVPYHAMIIAHERMNVFAGISILEALLRISIVFLLYHSMFDKLISFAVMIFVMNFILSAIYVLYSRKQFPESNFEIQRDKSIYKNMMSYSSWNLIGNIAAVAKGQGANVLLNIFFGTTVNASYGVMLQVQVAVQSFVSNFQMAINPQIYKSYAAEDLKRMHNLVLQGSKFSFFLMALIIAPLLYSIDYILAWWLDSPPPYSGVFVFFSLVNILLESLSGPLTSGALAGGKIKWYQIALGGTMMLNLPLSYLLFCWTGEPVMFLYVAIILSIIMLFLRLLFLTKLIRFSVAIFFIRVMLPVILATTCSAAGIVLLYSQYGVPTGFFDLIKITGIILIYVLIVFYFIGCSKAERSMIYKFVMDKIAK